MESFKDKDKEQHRLFYMALPPNIYVPVSEQLKRCCKNEGGVSRLIVGSLSKTGRGNEFDPELGRETIWKRFRDVSRTPQEVSAQLERKRDLPYRPLPGKGDGKEYACSPIW